MAAPSTSADNPSATLIRLASEVSPLYHVKQRKVISIVKRASADTGCSDRRPRPVNPLRIARNPSGILAALFLVAALGCGRLAHERDTGSGDGSTSVPVATAVAQETTQAGDYLNRALRQRVEELKNVAARQPTDSTNVVARVDVLWPWANAYAMTGRPLPVELPAVVTRVRRQVEHGPELTRATYSLIDTWIRELVIKDEQPDAIGAVALTPAGPLVAGSWHTIEQTYTVGRMPMLPGGGILVAKQFLSDHGALQRDDPQADNYLAIRCSKPDARFVADEVSLRGMHGGRCVAGPQNRTSGGRLSARAAMGTADRCRDLRVHNRAGAGCASHLVRHRHRGARRAESPAGYTGG